MVEKTKVIRIGADSYNTLARLSTSCGKPLGTLVNEWASRIQDAINEDAKNATKIDIVTFRPKGKSLVVATVLVPTFYGKLDLGNEDVDFTDFKNIVSARKVKFSIPISGAIQTKDGEVKE